MRANGESIRNVDGLIKVIKFWVGKLTIYEVLRDGKALPPFTITPRASGKKGIIGVTPKIEVVTRTLGFGQAAMLAVVLPFDLTLRNLGGIADLIERRSTEGITGPVGMSKLVAEQAQKGVFSFVQILVAISVALGLFNLLPFPALDGGRLVFLGYELVTRKRPNERIEAAVHAVGLLFLLGVIALVTLRDVVG